MLQINLSQHSKDLSLLSYLSQKYSENLGRLSPFFYSFKQVFYMYFMYLYSLDQDISYSWSKTRFGNQPRGNVNPSIEFTRGKQIIKHNRWQQRNIQIIHDVTSIKVNKENEIFSYLLTCFPILNKMFYRKYT